MARRLPLRAAWLQHKRHPQSQASQSRDGICQRDGREDLSRKIMRISEKIPNKQYNLAASNSLPVRIAAHQRRVMYERFIIEPGISEQDRILDVGVTADRFYESSNYLEAWYPHKSASTAVGIDDASLLAELYPGIRYLSSCRLTTHLSEDERRPKIDKEAG